MNLRVTAAACVLALSLCASAPTPAPAAETVLTPVADTWVNSGSPSTRYGSSQVLRSGNGPTRWSYTRFDLRGIRGTIQRISLRTLPERNSSVGFDVRHVASDSWSESTTNWSTAPVFATTSSGRSGALRSGVRTSTDVTALAPGDGIMSLALVPSTTSTGITSSLFSREAGTTRTPQLVVQTADPAPDTTPPSVQLTAPAAGTTLKGTTTLAATATDAVGVARVEFLADGAVVGVDGVAPYTAPWDTSTIADGAVTLAARAVDGAGNAATSPGVAVSVKNAAEPPPPDVDAPETSLTAGPSGIARSAIARFSFAATETGSTFQCKLDDGIFTACRSGEALHVANGRHTLAVRAIDPAGNVDGTPVTRTWWADATLQNGLFEADPRGWAIQKIPTPGWAPYQGTVTILPGGISGNKARVEVVPGQVFYSLDTSPHPVDSSVAGTRYVATGSIRSDRPGKRVCLQVRERDGATVVATTRLCAATTSAWASLPEVAHTATASGNKIEVDVFQQDDAVTGDHFALDGLELDDGTSTGGTPPTPAGDPVLLGLGDIASCWSAGDEATARLLDTVGGTIAALGDTEQNYGSADEFAGCFEPAWGRHKDRMKPAVGDHEYRAEGATPYWDYFGERAGPRGKGWYSYDLGDWHVVVLNSNCFAVGCGPGSEQLEWLEADLAANAKDCTAAYFHYPRFSAGSIHGNKSEGAPFWDVLYRYGAEFVMGGNDHTYQRFAPQRPDGTLDRERGMRQFVVGTGGTEHYPLGPPQPNTEVQNTGTFGALKMTLRSGSYDWQFVPQAGKTFTDTGSTACSPLQGDPPPPPPDTEAPTVALTAPAAGTEVSGPTTLTADASDAGSGVESVEFLAGSTVVGSDTTAPYTATWDPSGASGSVALTARARDTAGNARTSDPVTVTVAGAPPPPPPPSNLLPNGSFESSTSGWYGYRGALSRVSGGHSGSSALRVTWNGAGSNYSVMTDPHPIGATTAGERYAATAWVRSQTPGRKVCLRLREFNSSRAVIGGSSATCVTTTGSWQQIPDTTHTALGGASMDLYAYSDGPLAGDSFELDTVSASKR